MKIWTNYGSEHSMNLVLIGKFKQARDAQHVENIIKKISEQVEKEAEDGDLRGQRFSTPMLNFLAECNLCMLGPSELEQFTFEYRLDRDGNMITLKTEEVDVSAFIKVFIHAGGRVEVFSAHDYSPEIESDLSSQED